MSLDVEAGSTPAAKIRRESRSVSSIDACLPHQPLFAARRKKYRRCSGNVFNHTLISPQSSSSSHHDEPDQWEEPGALPLTIKDLLPQGCDSSRTMRIITVIVMTLMGFLVIFPIAPRLLAALAV